MHLLEDVKIKIIKFGSKEYKESVRLRDETLRKPIGLSIYDEDLTSEINDYHIGAFINKQLVGILILTKLNEKQIKMRQVGVTESMRGKNIGKELVKFSEELAFDLGFKEIVLNARETVVVFYEKLSYKIVSDKFIEVILPHYKMQKTLSDTDKKVRSSIGF